MRTAVDVLASTRSILAVPGGWTHGVMARDSNGCATDTTDEKACSFCLMGAMFRVTKEPGAPVEEAASFLRLAIGGPITSFNDKVGRTQTEVVAVVDKAIELARGGAHE